MNGALQGRAAWLLWGGAALVVALLPLVFSSGASLTMMSLMGFAIIFALSYNMLLGQTGMLSFGHAVYYGLGGFITAHALNVVASGKLPIPLPVMPIVGGLAGLTFAIIFGWVSTKRAGTAFAMISLGIGELVAACSLILRGFFGGEGGISTSRTKTLSVFGLNFGPQIQMYYLIAAWTLLCVGAMYAITRTPLGRMSNAVRDNPERAEFVGYSTQMVRFLMFCLSGFFAGVAGGLAAIHYEIVTSSMVGAAPSGFVLLMAYIGGVAFFIGPIIGAVLMTALQISLSDYTGAWQL
jgi:branched-chain amino acid transport system permease protein